MAPCSSFSAVVVGDAGVTVRCLEILRDRGKVVRGIVTGDGRVAAWGVANCVPVLFHDQATRLHARNVEELAGGPFDVLFSIHNLRILPPELLALPRLAAINYHDALLPRYAGLNAPTLAIAWGESSHGITWHRMTAEIDKGEILEQREIVLAGDETAWSLGGRCLEAACDAFASIVDHIANGTLTSLPQPSEGHSYFSASDAPTPGCLVHLDASAEEIERHVRALQYGPSDNRLGLPAVLTSSGPIAVESVTIKGERSNHGEPGSILRAEGRTIDCRSRTNDVRLTLEREPADTELRSPPIDVSNQQLWNKLARAAKRNEGWWIERLASLRPFPAPLLAGEWQSVATSLSWELPLPDADRTILAFVNVLAREVGESFDLAFSEADLRERVEPFGSLLVTAPPLRVPAPHSPFDASALAAARAELAGRETYSWDLTRRIRRLHGVPDPPMRLSIGGDHPPVMEGATLDALLSKDGTKLLLRSHTASQRSLGLLLDRIEAELSSTPHASESLVPVETAPTLLKLFDAQVRERPNAVAIEGVNSVLSYGALAERSKRLAAALRRRGAGDELLIALRTDDLCDLVTAMLAVFQAGSAFLVIDGREAPRRNARILADAKPLLVLGDRSIRAVAPELPQHPIALADADERPPMILPKITSNTVAYVAYTSGSSGPPKGVTIEHGSLGQFITAAGHLYGFDKRDRVLQFGALSFDLAYEQIFGALAHGSTLVELDGQYEGPQELLQACRRLHITVLDVPTAVFAQLAHAVDAESLAIPEMLRLTIVGGDALQHDDAARWNRSLGQRRDSRLINGYGPTEATVVVTSWEIPIGSAALLDRIPIGTPLDLVTTRIVDSEGNLANEGELWLGGPQVARGYHRHPELTAQRFVVADGSRFFRTGDLVRRRGDGLLEMLGRIDRQIKIGSRRVEPGEIESVLCAIDGVSAAAVLPVQADDGTTALRAWIVPVPGSPITTALLRERLVEELPPAMRPTRIDLCETIPRSGSGKIDFALLLETAVTSDTIRDESAPRAGAEQTLAILWNRILGCGAISRSDDFFDIGGDSLAAVTLLESIERELGVRLPLRAILHGATIASLAEMLVPAPPPADSCLVPIQTGGSEPPLFWVHGLGGHVLRLSSLIALLPADQPLYGVQSRGLDDDGPLLRSIEEMATVYLDEIEALVAPGTPLRLTGYSLGGVIAFEMARQALARGLNVGFLGLFDTVFDDLFPELRPRPSWRQSLRGSTSKGWRRFRHLLRRLIVGDERPGGYRNFRRVFIANREALQRYRPGRYPGTVTFFSSHSSELPSHRAFRERTLCRFEVIAVSGDHLSMIKPPHLASLIRLLCEAMAAPTTMPASPSQS